MTRQRKRISSLLPSLFAVGCLAFAPSATGVARTIGDSPEVAKLMAQAKTEALELKRDANDMERFTRSRVGWQTHATQVTFIKEHVNKTGKLLAELNQVRSSGSAWQQKAIDRIEPLLRELASNIEATINHINENQNRLHTPEFEKYLAANNELASELATLVSDYVDYGEAREKFEKLEKELKTH